MIIHITFYNKKDILMAKNLTDIATKVSNKSNLTIKLYHEIIKYL